MLGPVRILEQLPAELSRTVHPDDLYQYSLSDDLISYYQLQDKTRRLHHSSQPG